MNKLVDVDRQRVPKNTKKPPQIQRSGRLQCHCAQRYRCMKTDRKWQPTFIN